METKRCQRCHKLLRAEAHTCSRCGGYDFLPVSQAKPRHTGVLLAGETSSASSRVAQVPSPVGSPPSPLSPLPPTQLSPHRAGHSSGLHPEDEPYQSSFLPVQRLPLIEQPALEVEEVEDLAFSTVPDMPSAPVAAPPTSRRVASLAPLPAPRQQRSTQSVRVPSSQQGQAERDLAVARAYASAATIADPQVLAPAMRRPGRRERSLVMRLLLILSCFLFVMATGILIFLLIDSGAPSELKPRLTAQLAGPLRVNDTLLLSGSRYASNSLVTITRDANIPVLDAQGRSVQARTFSTGNFFVWITIGKDWSVGPHVIYATDQQGHKGSFPLRVQETPKAPPFLQLSLNHIDLGVDRVGVKSHNSITLTNSGGGEVNWQGSSDSPDWLSLTPTSGSFAGSREVVITVDRTGLEPGSYTGYISFTRQDSTQAALELKVTMGVNPAASATSANLVISNAAFTFSGNPVTSPAAQPITIQNTGGKGLNWTAAASTASGGNWLSLSSSAGYLAAGAVSNMRVSVVSTGLGLGTYQGTITFSYAGASAAPVTVTLTVTPPPVAKITLSSVGLSFHAIMGQNPQAQNFTITNSGTAPLNWGILEDKNGQTYAPVSQSNGTLAPSKSIVITVSPSIAQAGAGALSGVITVVDTDTGTQVKSQQIKVTFTIVNQAIISLDQYQMTFDHSISLQINVSTALLTVTNTGSAPLKWSLSMANGSPVQWLSVDISSGTLQPGGADFINVQCDSTHLSVGTFRATLTLRDTATVNPAPPQVVTVTLVVSQ